MASEATATKNRTWTPDGSEKEIDNLISRRAELVGNPEWHQQEWDESVRAYHMRTARERRLAWLRHHERMQRLHASLAAEHERAITALTSGA